MREIITLQCPACKNRNYSTTKNKKTTTGPLEFSKFCNTCRSTRTTKRRSSNSREQGRAGPQRSFPPATTGE